MSNTIAGTITVHRIPGQYLAHVNARRVDNGEPEQYTARVYKHDVDAYQQRNNATIVLH
ncbi:hypothetical protein SEA_VINE_35 [Gordonia phage Vine]|uniref:Uncharacterized protein n=1 Tax=Gordonia phage Vine TaxID=2857501 RepID=A0AAE7XBT0_9CAUD|nr:hypothetical protein PP998_gp35 [Gordonia phage Vine]QZD97744.1 hypothetical protein SEA_VINE_35 [Gordonia phage Vine]